MDVKKTLEYILDVVSENCGYDVTKCIDKECIFYEIKSHNCIICLDDDCIQTYYDSSNRYEAHYTDRVSKEGYLSLKQILVPFYRIWMFNANGLEEYSDVAMFLLMHIASQLLNIPIVSGVEWPALNEYVSIIKDIWTY